MNVTTLDGHIFTRSLHSQRWSQGFSVGHNFEATQSLYINEKYAESTFCSAMKKLHTIENPEIQL
jgi:hypothetical protein